jgi:hypothetical protein
MPARNRNFIIQWGDDFQRQINLRSGPEADIAEFTGEFIIRNDDGTELHSADTTNGQLVLHNGYIDIDIGDAVITALDLSGLSRSGTIAEPAPCDEIPYSATGPLANYVLRVTSTSGISTTLLTGQCVFAGVV